MCHIGMKNDDDDEHHVAKMILGEDQTMSALHSFCFIIDLKGNIILSSQV